MAGLSDAEVLRGLCAALALWPGGGGYAARAARDLAARDGASETMLRYGLQRAVAAHRRDALARWLADARTEAGGGKNAMTPDSGWPGAAALGPEIVLQVLAGNVAGLAIPATLEALLARSAVLLKPASDDPVTPVLLKESLNRAAPRLGNAVAVVRADAGIAGAGADRPATHGLDDALLRKADMVVASGGEEMTAELPRRVHGPLLLYGPKISIGLIGALWTRAPQAWWEQAAREIVLWDQRGCLSPRILFLAGDRGAFADRLARALAQWETRWPARPRTAGEAAAVHAFRARYEMGDGKRVGLVAPRDTAWTVAWDEDVTLDAGPPARVVRVAPLPDAHEMEVLFRAGADRVQGAGIAHAGRQEDSWQDMLARAGIPFVTALTRIQDPPAGWRADGRSGLVALLRRGRSRKANGEAS